MKIIMIVFILGLFYSQVNGQVIYEYNKVPVVMHVVEHSTTLGIDSLFSPEIATESQIGSTQVPNPSNLPLPVSNKIKLQENDSDSGAINQMKAPSPAPTSSFLSLNDNNGQIPPDTHGAANSNYLMTTLNTEIRIQNKSGVVQSTQSLSSFWSSFTFSTIFDPRIHYDSQSNRWVFVVCIDKNSPNSSLLIAVSATSNPTGTWYQWQVDADSGNLNWYDYPTVGINNRWIVVSGNMFTNSTNAWASPQIIVFDKSSLYSNGTGSYSSIYPGTGVGGTFAPSVNYDPTISNVFLVQDYNGNSGGFGFLSLSKINGTTTNPILNLHYSFPATASTWNWSSGTADFAQQLNSLQKIQNNDSKMQNVVYRNSSLWCTHHVFLPATSSTHTAVQWWELDTLGNITQRARIEDISANIYYAFPSIAVNANDDVLIGYSSFSSSQYASGEYSYRNHNDAANTIRSPYKFISGVASYYKTHSGTKNRWGDYSATIVDPSNDLDFWTIQEYAEAQSLGIDRWGTYWANVTCPLPLSTFTVSSSTTDTNVPIVITGDETNASASFNWNFDGGNAVPGIGQGPHNVDWSTAGIKNVTLVTSLNGCSALQTSTSITVTIPASISNLENENVIIYPNPFSESISIKTDQSIPGLFLFDECGRLIRYYSNVENGSVIDTQMLNKGIYFLRINHLVVKLIKL